MCTCMSAYTQAQSHTCMQMFTHSTPLMASLGHTMPARRMVSSLPVPYPFTHRARVQSVFNPGQIQQKP